MSRASRPGAAALLTGQVRHEFAVLRRTPIVLILAIGLPLGFYALVSAVVGNETIDARAGIRVAQFLAPAFASFGVVMSTFSFLAIGLAEARATGVLKRQNGTPLPRWAMLGGRMGAAMLLGLTSAALVLGAGAALYDVRLIGRTLVAVVVTILLASLAFSALGLAVAALAQTPQAAQALTNGLVIPLAFLSDIFTFSGEGAPRWLTTIGWVFPLKHLVNALGDAFNPYLTGTGFAPGHLGVIVAWGIAGALAAAWFLRASRERSTSGGGVRGRTATGDGAPRRAGRPRSARLVADQMGHTATALGRDFGAVFFSVVFPVLLVVLIPAVSGGGDVRLDDGTPLVSFFAATMAVYGAAVTGYVSIAEGVAEDRARKVLKRTRGTPLPAWAFLLGRVAGAVLVSLLTLVACYAAAALLYRVPLPTSWAGVVAVLVLAAVCFATLGLAVVSLVRSAQSVIGVTLGTLLPLAFISDVFIIGADLPPVIEGLSWAFPLRHATRAMTEANAGIGASADHLAVLAVWTVVALAVVAWRFAWEGTEPGGRRRRPGKRAGAAARPDPVPLNTSRR